MILSQVRQILLCAISEPCPALNLIAFHRGDVVPDWLLARAIDAAHRGHITARGKQLHLISLKFYEQANRNSVAKIKALGRRRNGNRRNLTPWPEIQKVDCIPLPNFLPRNTAQLRARLSQYYVSSPHEQRAPGELKATLVPRGQPEDKGNANCLACGTSLAGKRRGSKYCDKNCKQQAYRKRGRG